MKQIRERIPHAATPGLLTALQMPSDLGSPLRAQAARFVPSLRLVDLPPALIVCLGFTAR